MESSLEKTYGVIPPITSVTVGGFKSLAEEQRVEIRPLTLLAGANSSGKSSLMQPLLLLKQTLEEGYNPGALLLNGPHISFTSGDQIVSKVSGKMGKEFRVGFDLEHKGFISTFRLDSSQVFDLPRMDLRFGKELMILEEGKDASLLVESLVRVFPQEILDVAENLIVIRHRCFLQMSPNYAPSWMYFTLTSDLENYLRMILHVPGLRGNPSRSYGTTAIGPDFPGTFENYVASLILSWQKAEDEKLGVLGDALLQLGLASRVEANPLDATRVELLVTRLVKSTKKSDKDLVNIADVGFGVSQVLPVVVALFQARPGQLVYIEQPELHLHPRAQQVLASILADAANRGVRVVAETHSTVLLRAVQTLVAQDKLDPASVILHWFQRDKRGATKITSAELDERGAYGDWPEDFGEVEAAVDNAYLDAVEAKMFPPGKKTNARK